MKRALAIGLLLAGMTPALAQYGYDADRQYNEMHMQNLERANEADTYRLQQQQRELERMQYDQEQRLRDMEHRMEQQRSLYSPYSLDRN